MESLDVIKFGIFDDFSHVFGTGAITNVLPLNHREMIISTTKEIIKIERNIIKMRHPIKFSTCAIVPGTDFLIGVTVQRGDIVIYQIGDLPQKQQSYNSRSIELPPPILGDYPTNQSGIFHMIYSPKSQSIITIGAGIKVFNLQYKLSRISVIKPTVSITHRSSFASDYYTTILVPPAFDTDSELILLPTDDGICAFNLDGVKVIQCSKYPASVKTVYATHPSKPPKLKEVEAEGKPKKQITMSKKLLTYDSNKGMTLWGKNGQKVEEFNTIGSSVLSIMFVDSENALCLNSNHEIFYLNIKTGKSFFCLNLEKNPSRIFLTFVNKEPIFCACFSSYMRALKVVIPWNVWNLNIDKAFLICRCNKFRAAARVLIDSENSFIKLYSPRNGTKMTVATPAEAARSVSFLYDRGIVENYIFDADHLRYNVKVMRITNETQSKEEDQANKEKPNEKADEQNDDNNIDEIQNNGRDILFIILENGTILGFDTNVSNCEEVMKMKCKAAFMSICRIRSTKKRNRSPKKQNEEENEEDKISYQWCYAVASEKSDLFILDYFSMKEVRHFTVSDDKLIKMFYHFDSECIIMVFERKTIMFNLEKGKIVSTVLVGGNQITTMFANFIIYGYESGHIRRVSIENGHFTVVNDNNKKKKTGNNEEEEDDDDDEDKKENEKEKEKSVVVSGNSTLQKPHDGPITGFSFSQKIWISSGLDGNVIIWDYNFEKVYKIVLPLPLKACLIMNGKREILVATNTEVMKIKDKYLLDYYDEDPYDAEIAEIDNFDRNKDALCHDTVEAFDPDAYENMSISDILSDEDEEEEEKEKKINDENDKKKKFDTSNVKKNFSKTSPPKQQQQSTTTTPEETHHENTKKSAPHEDTKEDIQKKLEMMQSMNGLSGPSNTSNAASIPKPSSSTSASSSKPSPQKPPPEKKKEEKKEVEVKKKKPPKDGKALNDFINDNIEQEKAQNKRKKVKKNNNQDKEPVKEEGPKKSEEEVANMIGNLFDRNKPKNTSNSNNNKKKTSGDGIDFNELAKKFNKDEDPLVINTDKADLSKKTKQNENSNDDDDDDDDEDDDEKEKENENAASKKKNQNSKPDSKTSTTTSKPSNSSSQPKSSNKQPSSNSNTKSSTKPSKDKENAKSTAPSGDKDKENKAAAPKKEKEKKPAKSSSSPKQQKDSTTKNANNKPQESSTNDAKPTSNNNNNNNSPKKVKQTTSPSKSSTKPATSNANSNNFNSSPAPSSSSSNVAPKTTSNPTKLAPTTSTTSSTAPSATTKPSSSSNAAPTTNPAKAASNTPLSKLNNNNNNNNGGNDANRVPVSSNPSSNKISVGTQGETFGDDNGEDGKNGLDENNKPNNEDPLNIQIKMNGNRPETDDLTNDGNEDATKEEDDTNINDSQAANEEELDNKNDKEDDEKVTSLSQNNSQADSDNQKATNKNEEEPQSESQKENTRNSTTKPSSVNQSNNQNEDTEKVDDDDITHNSSEKRPSSSDSRPQRAPTPPPIRPQIHPNESKTSRASYRRRPKTPPPRREAPPSEFKMPPPNVIIDQEAVLVLYGRGRLEFKPLVDRIQRDMMIASNRNGFYNQNRRITLAYVQNYRDSLNKKKKLQKDDELKSEVNEPLSKTAQPIAPPIQPPKASSSRSLRNYDDRRIFEGSVNSVSPAFKNRNRNGLSSTIQPTNGNETNGENKSGVDVFNVTIENGVNNSKSSRLKEVQIPFSPAAYVFNYSSNTETVINDLDTTGGVTTPRKSPEDDDEDVDVTDIDVDSKCGLRSPRRIQSARAVGRPLYISTPGSQKQVRMPFPLSPIVMASPRRSVKKRPQPLIESSINNGSMTSENDEENDNLDEGVVSADQLESAVMSKMPRLNFTNSSQNQSRNLNSPVESNRGAAGVQWRPNSVRAFDRSPLVFNQPIGAGMVKPGGLKKRNNAFYASVAVTTSISNARRSSPGYRTGSSRSKRQMNQNSRKSGNSQIDDLGGLSRTPTEIEITV